VGLEGRTETEHITNKPKGLKGSPIVGMKLRRGNFKFLKDTHDKLIKGKNYVKVREEAGIGEGKGRFRGSPIDTNVSTE